MNQAYLLIGGNEGNRIVNLELARDAIERYCGTILLQSSLYETAAWGYKQQPSFLNQALLIQTAMVAPVLMQFILQTEERLGRKRLEKYGPRIIDIDILFFNQEVYDLPDLKIPHPEIENRRFALEPMAELAPFWMHPVLHRTIEELLASCSDPLDVKKL